MHYSVVFSLLVIISMNELIECLNVCKLLKPNGVFDGIYQRDMRKVMYKSGQMWEFEVKREDNRLKMDFTDWNMTYSPNIKIIYDIYIKDVITEIYISKVEILNSTHIKICSGRFHEDIDEKSLETCVQTQFKFQNTIVFNTWESSENNFGFTKSFFVTQKYDKTRSIYERNYRIYDNSLNSFIETDYPKFLRQIDPKLLITGILSEYSGHLVFFRVGTTHKLCYTTAEDLSTDCKPENLVTFLDECKRKESIWIEITIIVIELIIFVGILIAIPVALKKQSEGLSGLSGIPQTTIGSTLSESSNN